MLIKSIESIPLMKLNLQYYLFHNGLNIVKPETRHFNRIVTKIYLSNTA